MLTLSQIRHALQQERERMRSFDGGDRAPSPPASLLQRIADLEKDLEDAIEALWVERTVGPGEAGITGAKVWALEGPVGEFAIQVIQPAPGHDAFAVWIFVNGFLVQHDTLGGFTPAEARREAVTRALRTLQGAVRALRTSLGFYP